jgi:hypothetical protein
MCWGGKPLLMALMKRKLSGYKWLEWLEQIFTSIIVAKKEEGKKNRWQKESIEVNG